MRLFFDRRSHLSPNREGSSPKALQPLSAIARCFDFILWRLANLRLPRVHNEGVRVTSEAFCVSISNP